MTPLAAHLAKQLVARPKHRVGIWEDPDNIKRLRQYLDDIHCFEITAAMPALKELSQTLRRQPEERQEALFNTYAFLPAPKTWIEWKHFSGNRVAVHLQQPVEGETDAAATMFTHEMAQGLGAVSTTSGWYNDFGDTRYFPDFFSDTGPKTAIYLLSVAHIVLVMINSPKIIGRRQHMPNRALERELTRGFGVGKFPLHAWTEIKLEVAKPPEIDDGEPHEAHLTGRRALHFCRKHIRIRRGQLEYVSAHWRGDPALGIKRSRYVVSA